MSKYAVQEKCAPDKAEIVGRSYACIVAGVICVGFALSCFGACSTTTMHPEVVLLKGMRVHARTSEGEITITAGKGYERLFEWNGCKKRITLWARKTSWHGKKGLYYPAPGRTWLFGCGGVDRAGIEESGLFFENESEFLEWIRKYRSAPYVYRNDGLVVGFQIRPKADILVIDFVSGIYQRRETRSFERS
jgi:hypothetical protein